jgi:hypothetical protein
MAPPTRLGSNLRLALYLLPLLAPPLRTLAMAKAMKAKKAAAAPKAMKAMKA